MFLIDNDTDNDNSNDDDSDYGNNYNDNNIQTSFVSFMTWRQLIRFSVNYVPQTFSNFAKKANENGTLSMNYLTQTFV